MCVYGVCVYAYACIFLLYILSFYHYPFRFSLCFLPYILHSKYASLDGTVVEEYRGQSDDSLSGHHSFYFLYFIVFCESHSFNSLTNSHLAGCRFSTRWSCRVIVRPVLHVILCHHQQVRPTCTKIEVATYRQRKVCNFNTTCSQWVLQLFSFLFLRYSCYCICFSNC